MTPVKLFVRWGRKGCWCLIVPLFVILQARPPSAVRSSLAFIIQDYPSTDCLTRSDKITARGSIPAGKTKVALESFSHSLQHTHFQLPEVFQGLREDYSSSGCSCAWLMDQHQWNHTPSAFITHHQHKSCVMVSKNELAAKTIEQPAAQCRRCTLRSNSFL